jgi:hypothetical protein
VAKSISKALLDTIAERSGTVITEREMKALKKRWNPFFVRQYGIDLVAEYDKFVLAAPFLVSPEQTEKGLKWWKDKVFLPDGKVRNTAFVKENMRERYIEVLRDFDRFEFVDWEFVGNHGFEHLFPVYRVIAKRGDGFKYAAKSWQSGGTFVE